MIDGRWRRKQCGSDRQSGPVSVTSGGRNIKRAGRGQGIAYGCCSSSGSEGKRQRRLRFSQYSPAQLLLLLQYCRPLPLSDCLSASCIIVGGRCDDLPTCQAPPPDKPLISGYSRAGTCVAKKYSESHSAFVAGPSFILISPRPDSQRRHLCSPTSNSTANRGQFVDSQPCPDPTRKRRAKSPKGRRCCSRRRHHRRRRARQEGKDQEGEKGQEGEEGQGGTSGRDGRVREACKGEESQEGGQEGQQGGQEGSQSKEQRNQKGRQACCCLYFRCRRWQSCF